MSRTVKSTMQAIRKMGLNVSRTAAGEYRIVPKGAGETQAYYTNDETDALATAANMRRSNVDKMFAHRKQPGWLTARRGPKPSKLYAVGNGKRTFVGDAYTLDAAAEAAGEDDWPKGCLAILVEPNGRELVLMETGEWDEFTEEGGGPECSDCGAGDGQPHGERCTHPSDETTALRDDDVRVRPLVLERIYRAAFVPSAHG